MINIDYSDLEITENSEAKPSAFSNRQYQYNEIGSDRRFEELVYSLVKLNLGTDPFSQYDKISLMSGVSELGRDCALFKNGHSEGIIQCKKYTSNLSKKDFGKEITKFVLYSLQEKKILYNPEIFTYYIAVSKGFTRECSDFIDSFKIEILTENDLTDWVDFNINKYKSLNHLKIKSSNTCEEVRNILSKLSVTKISPQDLDLYLNNDRCSYLANSFFEVKTVVDNTSLDNFKDEILKILPTRDVDKLKLQDELDRGSISLKSERNQFTEIPDSHIKRNETDLLFNWICKDSERNSSDLPLNICLLAANAGMGKTVILKDLFDRLVTADIAVLGLKADKLVSSSIKDLQYKIGLSVPIYEFIEACKQKYKTTVILIDQIDALSQSVSSDRSYLQVFKNLVDQYMHDENIKIIISVRIFDLHYDPSLQLYKNIETVTVKLLDIDQVLLQLGKLGINKNMLSDKLINLLQVPNHLNVFSRIYKVNSTTLGINTLQDMYQELWRQKVTDMSRKDSVDKKRTKKLLYKIAEKMFKDQHITVSELQFEDYSQELRYLESERLIKKEDYQLQFFHQSFYDFVFSKQFVESGQNLNRYIKKNGQSILQRSAVKMMLNYLRDYDKSTYLKAVKAIFTDDEVLYHIKHLTLSSVVFYEKTTMKESDIILDSISVSLHLYILFFEQAVSDYWFQFAVKHSLLDILVSDSLKAHNYGYIEPNDFQNLKTAAFNFLRNASIMNYEGSWQFIAELPDKFHKLSMLRYNTDWTDPIKYKIFESCKDCEESTPYFYFRVLNNIAKVDPQYAVRELSYLVDIDHKKRVTNNNTEKNNVLKTLAKETPESLIPLLSEILLKKFGFKVTNGDFFVDYSCMTIFLPVQEDLIRSEYYFCLLAICLRRMAKFQQSLFLEFYEKYKQSGILPIIRLLIFALRTNEDQYPSQIYQLTTYLLAIDKVNYTSYLQKEMRIIFEKAFPLFSTYQQDLILDKIKKIANPHEVFKINGSNDKYKLNSFWGHTKYSWIKRLPEITVQSDKDLRKMFLELARKFPNFKDEEKTGSVMAGVVQAPLSQDAYKMMSEKQWLSSFKKYDGTIGHFERPFLKGDIEEHANAFKQIVLEKPSSTMLRIIKAALDDSDIKSIYPMKGIWGWSESQADRTQIIPLFKQLLKHPEINDLKQYCIYIAENLLGGEKEDEEIVHFLIRSTIDFQYDQLVVIDDGQQETDNPEENLLMKGLNTFNGSAASSLVKIIDKDYADLIFNTLDFVLSIAPEHLRAVVLYKFANLMQVDPDRAFEIFKSALVRENNVNVLAASIWSLNYMGYYNFEALIPVYERMVLSEKLGNDSSESIFRILYFSFLNNTVGANELLYKLLENNKFARASSLPIILEYYYTFADAQMHNAQLLVYLTEKITKDDFDEHGLQLYNFYQIKLTDIKSFLTKLIQSSFFRINDSLIDYLTSQCSLYPEDAIELFELTIQTSKFSSSDYDDIHSSESGTKFIVSAFNALIKNDRNSEDARWKLMLAFDSLLKDRRFKVDTDKVLEELS